MNHHIAHGRILYLVFQKVLFKDSSCLTSFYVTYFWNMGSLVSLGSLLGPLLFNVFLCKIFSEHEDSFFTNYADDTTTYVMTNDAAEVTNQCHWEALYLVCQQSNEIKPWHILPTFNHTRHRRMQTSKQCQYNKKEKEIVNNTRIFDNKLNLTNILRIYSRVWPGN